MDLMELHTKFELKISKGVGRRVNTEKYIHTYIHEANHFNWAYYYSSSRHSKKSVSHMKHISFVLNISISKSVVRE